MIGQIKGRLIGKNAPEILVEIGGMTYEIFVPMSTLYKLPDLGGMVHLHTHFRLEKMHKFYMDFLTQRARECSAHWSV